MELATDNDKSSPVKTWLFLTFIIIVTVWYFLGDGIGFEAVSSLFAGLAFAGVIAAIVLQKQELELQRKELRYARIAHQETAKALIEQTEIESFRRALEQERLLRIFDLNLVVVTEAEQSGDWQRLVMDNQGGPVRDVRLTPGSGLSIREDSQQSEWWYPSVRKIYFKLDPQPGTSRSTLKHFSFTALYKNKFGQPRTKSFDVTGDGRRYEIREIETVTGEHLNHLDQLGAHVSDEIRKVALHQTHGGDDDESLITGMKPKSPGQID